MTSRSSLHWTARRRGYLTRTPPPPIAAALRTVTAGQALLDPAVQGRLIDTMTSRRRHVQSTDLPDGLTAREAEALALIATGLSNVEIAAALVVTEATVETHINHLLAKTGKRDRAQLVAYASPRPGRATMTSTRGWTLPARTSGLTPGSPCCLAW